MAQLTFAVTRAGLAVPVWVGLSGKTTAPLLAAGRQVAAPVRARGLLDTGSDVTAVAAWVLQRLAVPVATTTSTHTVGGLVPVNLNEVSVGITDPQQSQALWVTESDLI